jgi:hypothetical protein
VGIDALGLRHVAGAARPLTGRGGLAENLYIETFEECRMKLIINRSQQDVKGMLGGHKGVSFTLSYRVELGHDELELVQRYKLEEYPVTWHTVGDQRVPDDTIRNMLQGRSQTVRDVKTLLGNEAVVKDACDGVATLFQVVRTFGGDEVIEYPRNGPTGDAR